MVDMLPHGEHGAAWRRRQRRLRSWWRHEQQSVAMALSAAAHHSYDKVAAGAKYDGLRAQKTVSHGPGRLRTELHGDRGPEQPGKCSSSCLTKTPRGCGPGFSQSLGRRNGSSGTPRSTLSTSSAVRPWCRFSTLLCRRRWNSSQMCSSSSARLRPILEPVIEVPKIFLGDDPMRAVLRDPQLAEQLVEVPTTVSYSWLQLRMEQTVDIPVPGRGGRSSGLQGFLPGEGSTALLSSGECISERTVEQTVDPPGGGLQDFRPGLSSSYSYFPAGVPDALDEPGQGGFRTFPQTKKSAKSGLHSTHPRQLLSSVFVSRSGSWSVRRPWRQLTMATWVGLGSLWRRLCLGAAGQLWRLLEEFPALRGRCSHLGIWTLPSPSFLSACPVFGCLGVACGAQRMDFLYVEVDSKPEAFFSIRLNGEVYTVDATGCIFFQRGLHVEIWTLFLQVLHFCQFAAFFAAQCSWSPR